jgi:ribokinase
VGRVLVIGSVNDDVVARVDRRPGAGETVLARTGSRSPGGKGANQAVAAARLGARVALIGAVGDDAVGLALVSALAAEGVDVGAVVVRRGTATGTALITVTDDGDNAIVVIAGANATVTGAEAETAAAALGPGDVLLTVLEVPLPSAVAAVRAAAAAGARAVLSVTPVQRLPAGVLELLDPVLVNEHEAARLLGVRVRDPLEAARALVRAGARSAVVTAGARGAAVASADGEREVASRAAAPVVDTTGAGDALAGALAAVLAAGGSLTGAVEAGVRVAGVSVTRAGAWPSYPRDVT